MSFAFLELLYAGPNHTACQSRVLVLGQVVELWCYIEGEGYGRCVNSVWCEGDQEGGERWWRWLGL